MIKCAKAKNEFYIACQNSQEIKGVGFSSENIFTIPRKDFMEHVLSNLSLESRSETLKLQRLTIVSPIIVDDRKSKWKFRIDGYGKKNFSMKMCDERFFDGVLSNKYKIKNSIQDTTIDAMVKYYETTNGNNEISVITVYRINHEIIEKIPDGIKFDCPIIESNSNQLELF